MRTYEVQRDRDKILSFTGEIIGSASSHFPGKDRWAEVAIYRTEAGSYIVSGVGRTTRDGEVDRYWADVCETAQAVVDRLYIPDTEWDDKLRRRVPVEGGKRHLPNVNRVALEDACERDDDLDRAFGMDVQFVP